MKVLLSRTDNTDMYRRALARHRTGAALLLGLSLRAPSASAEPAEPDETRVGTVEGKAAEELPSAAETPPILAAPVVTPRLIRDEGVAYPEQALGERFYERVEVGLIPELDASGHVRSSSVETPQVAGASLQVELDGADAQRASTLQDGSFALPALREGTATVRVESTAPGPANELPTGAGRRSACVVCAEPARRVTGRGRSGARSDGAGQRSAPGVSSSTREEVRRNPGAFGDPVRAVEALPGVTPVASGLPYFYVRGAPPGNFGYFLDRVRVLYLYNIGSGPSVVHKSSIDRVDLYPGGYPARFGRFAGGVVSAQMRGPEPAFSGEANLRLFDVGGLIETPFARGRGSLYSYGAALLSLLSPEVKLDSRDYRARATYEPSAQDRFSVFGFGSYDPLSEKRNGLLTRLGDACRPRITFTW
jgi:hypothetical protein